MKHILSLILCCLSITVFAQNPQGIALTKEVICKGAAVSVEANVHPLIKNLNFSRERVVNFTKDLVKPSIKDAPGKAYDWFKEGKTREQVTTLLYNEFMKLDDAVVSKFLINSDNEDYEDDYDDNDDY